MFALTRAVFTHYRPKAPSGARLLQRASTTARHTRQKTPIPPDLVRRRLYAACTVDLPRRSRWTRDVKAGFYDEYVKKGPANLLKWILLSLCVGTVLEQYRRENDELASVENALKEANAVTREVLLKTKEISVFPRIFFYSNHFSNDKIEEEIAQIESLIARIEDIDNKLIKSSSFTLRLLSNSRRISIEEQVKNQKKVLLLSSVILKAILLYGRTDYKKAIALFENAYVSSVVRNLTQTYFDASQAKMRPQHLQSLLSTIYNLQGLVLRAAASRALTKKDAGFIHAQNSFMEGLEVSIGRPLQGHSIEEKMRHFYTLCGTQSIQPTEQQSILLSNLGFLMNQRGKPECALKLHKTAHDFWPNSWVTTNGLGFALGQMAYITQDPALKQACYEEASTYLEYAIQKAPSNLVIISNKAWLALEKTEESLFQQERKALCEEACSLFEKVIEKQTALKGGVLGYAVALSRLASYQSYSTKQATQIKAKAYLTTAQVLYRDNTDVSAYIVRTLSIEGDYPLPPYNNNEMLRNTAKPVDMSVHTLSFYPENVQKMRLKTDRLIIRPIQDQDLLFVWQDLYGNQQTMSQYFDRQPQGINRVRGHVKTWTQYFREGNPYSAYVVETNDGSERQIGLIVIEASQQHEARPGVGQLFYLFSPHYQGLGYGKESLNAFVNEFVQKNLFNHPTFLVQGAPFQSIELTALESNQASTRIIEKYLKGAAIRKENKYGSDRVVYTIKQRELERG
ncbi:MAG: hypothetical protein S4CHLAM2_14740 [Chlamydiales bacterium]|nr:hypothetical protein [Chlamydiales bacterium]